jgi:hypothetical protein
LAQIDDHDLVAETVHLDEVAIGQHAHDNARMCRTYMRTCIVYASSTMDWGAAAVRA